MQWFNSNDLSNPENRENWEKYAHKKGRNKEYKKNQSEHIASNVCIHFI